MLLRFRQPCRPALTASQSSLTERNHSRRLRGTAVIRRESHLSRGLRERLCVKPTAFGNEMSRGDVLLKPRGASKLAAR